ncbi:MAG: hypothetical protein IRY97_03210, partial [Thermomicrobiaceae bacterium]|nr:hypothetical protein [Thermomicrobiaceae bacterium]
MARRVLRLPVIALILALVSASAVHAQGLETPAPQSGWRFADVTVDPRFPTAGQVTTVSFTVEDEAGRPIPGLAVSADLRAPTTAYGADPPEPILTTTGTPAGAPGRYQVTLPLNEVGRWWAEIQVDDSHGGRAHLNEFLLVDPSAGPTAAPSSEPLFLPADAWGAFYRLDPRTGSIVTLAGQEVIHAGGRWWLTDTQLEPKGSVSVRSGGTWRLRVDLTDGLTGKRVSQVDLGDVAASVYVGSADQPAIATALAFAPDASRLYLYWARQVGDEWRAQLAAVNPATGEVVARRALPGTLLGDGVWARLDLTPDGSTLIVAEQVVHAAAVSGFRIQLLRTDSLDLTIEHRLVDGSADPLTNCLLPYPGTTGPVAGSTGLRYALCSPTGHAAGIAVVTWDPVAGSVVSVVDLGRLGAGDPYYVDGALAADGRHFFVANALSHRIAEIDLLAGTVVREAAIGDQGEPSTWSRLRNWLFGLVRGEARAGVLLDADLALSPDGRELYLVSAAGSGDAGDGIWVIDTATLHPTGHLLASESVSGLAVAPSGDLAVVRRGLN